MILPMAAYFALVVLPSCNLVEPGIQLEKVPERLVLPLPPGRNEMLNALVVDSEAKAVWLAPDGDESRKAMMSHVGGQKYQINLADPAVERLFAGSGPVRHLRVYAQLSDDRIISSVAISLRGGPIHLKLPLEPTEIRVESYSPAAIDGSDNTLFLSLRDIAHGEATISVHGEDWESEIAKATLKEGDSLVFSVNGERWVVGCKKAVRKLIRHHSYGVFVVCAPAAWEKTLIDMALERIEKSEDGFLVDLKELTGKEFVKVARSKLKGEGAALSFQDFVSRVISGENQKTGPYQVRHGESPPVTTREWLLGQLTGRQIIRTTSKPSSGS